MANIQGTNGPDNLEGTNDADNIEGLRGDDDLFGKRGNDSLHGGKGSDLLRGDEGNDLLDGGGGRFDIADYRRADAGVSVELGSGVASDGLGGTDSLVHIEFVLGSDFGDSLTGDSKQNVLIGFDGDDALTGGAGDDFLDGVKGVDTLRGDAGDDFLEGGQGDDFLDGGIGDDFLDGRAGNDTMTGGDGDDLFFFKKDEGDDVITDFAAGNPDDVIDIRAFDFASPAAVRHATTDDGFGNCVVNLGGGDSIFLVGVERDDLLFNDDFLI